MRTLGQDWRRRRLGRQAQLCTVANATGTVEDADVTDVEVWCVTDGALASFLDGRSGLTRLRNRVTILATLTLP
jgi:hypothetical protein